MVLASLERLHIRALFSQTSSAVALRSVALEVAGEVGGGPPASNVELCMCPANYRGDSCQVRWWGRAPPARSPRFLPHPLGTVLPAALPAHHGPGQPAGLSVCPCTVTCVPAWPPVHPAALCSFTARSSQASAAYPHPAFPPGLTFVHLLVHLRGFVIERLPAQKRCLGDKEATLAHMGGAVT